MASAPTSRPASAASSASNKSGMKIKVPRPPRQLSNEQALARQQQHAEIDQKFASATGARARKKPAVTAESVSAATRGAPPSPAA